MFKYARLNEGNSVRFLFLLEKSDRQFTDG